MEQQLYELPEEWEWSTVKEISTKIQYGYTTKATESGNAKFLRITDIQNGNIMWASVPFVSISDKELSKYRLQSNDLVFARSGATAGKSILIEEPPKNAIFASYLIRVIPACLVFPYFLALFFQSPEYWKQVEMSASGAAQPNINGTKLSGFQVPLPPLDEQKRIVAKLDALFTRIDTAITHLQEVLALTKALFASALSEKFRSREKSWKSVILADVCAITSKLSDPREPAYIDMIHVGGANIEGLTGELHELKTAREEKLISGKFPFDSRMVLYSKIRPYLMKVARPDFSGICSADIYPLTPKEGVLDREFLFYLLLSEDFSAFAIQGSSRAGMPKVR